MGGVYLTRKGKRYLELVGCSICFVYDRPINLYLCSDCHKPVCKKDSEWVRTEGAKTLEEGKARVCSSCINREPEIATT